MRARRSRPTSTGPRRWPRRWPAAEVAYYLVHSLDRRGFARRDAAAARAFGAAAAGAGLRRIIYLGGLGDPDDSLSEHLRSRQEVEGLLGTGGVPVTTLRAGVVIGDRGTSWEMIRQLVERLPALLVPTWASTLTQPIAIADVVRYLVGVLDVPAPASQVFEIGGAEVLRYTEILSRLSAIEGRPSLLLPVPVPSARLAALVSSTVLPIITGVDSRTIRALVESLRNEVVVRDDSIRDLVPFEPMDYDARRPRGTRASGRGGNAAPRRDRLGSRGRSPVNDGLLVVGSGPAGVAAAVAYREAGGRGPVRIVTADEHLPYDRPPLSKDLLRGETHPDDIWLHPDEFYADRDIEIVRDAPVGAARPRRHRDARRRAPDRVRPRASWPRVPAPYAHPYPVPTGPRCTPCAR